MRISDWSSDVCSSDLLSRIAQRGETAIGENGGQVQLALDAIGPGDAQRYWPGRVDGNDRRQLAGRLRFRRVMWFIRHGDNPVPSPSVSPNSFSISAIGMKIGSASCRERVCRYG